MCRIISCLCGENVTFSSSQLLFFCHLVFQGKRKSGQTKERHRGTCFLQSKRAAEAERALSGVRGSEQHGLPRSE